MQAYADWLAHCIGKIARHERPILVGHSNAGPPVLLVAAQHPELLRAAVLCDSTGADLRLSLLRVLLGRVIDSAIEWRLTVLRFHHALYNLIFHTRNCLRQVYLAARYDARETARTIAIPVLIAWGARDHTFPPACGRLLTDCVERSMLEVFDRGSHDWLITHPSEFVDVLSRFLRARDCTTGATQLDTIAMRP
jgi:pimeloyl-ACP methyl ester carboxylesterase